MTKVKSSSEIIILKSSENKLTDMGGCNLNDREVKIFAVLKKLNELQESSERQFHELRNEINKQKE